MSWKNCAAAVREAAGRELSNDQVMDIFERAQMRQKALAAAGKLDDLDARLREAVAEDADALRVEAALAKKHAALSVIARDRALRQVERHIGSGLSYRKAVLALFEGTTRGVEGARHSIAATKLAYEARYVGGMMARVAREVPHAEGMLRDRAFLDDVVREMWELREGGTPGGTRNADAQKVARIFADSAEQSRTDLNRLGANIGKLDGWAGAQIHDADKIGRMAPEAWIDAVMPRLDLARTFPDLPDETAVRKVLRNVWDNIVFQRERGEAPDAAGSGFRGPVNVAKALERHRVLHFRSPDEWLSYSREFGHGHIFDGMVQHQSRAALNASQMSILGPNPGAALQAVLDGLRRRVDADDSIPPAEKAAVKAGLTTDSGASIGTAFRIASGAAMIPVSRTLAEIGGAVRAWQSLSKLGGAVISSITDLPVAITNLRFNGMTFGEAAGGQVRGLLEGRGRAEQRELAYLLGEGFDGVIGHLTSPYVANDSAPGAMQSVMATFFRWTGLTWWTDANRAAAARMLSAHLGQQAGKGFDALDPRLQNVLRQHDISPAAWDAMRAHGVREIEGKAYLAPDQLGTMPDEAVIPLARERLDAMEAGLSEREARRAAANAREAEWVGKRVVKFREGLARARDWAAELEGKVAGARERKVSAVAERIGTLEAQLSDLAEFYAAVRLGSRAVGRAEGSASRRIVEMEKTIRDIRREAEKGARDRSGVFIARWQERESSLLKFIEGTRERAAAREAATAAEQADTPRRVAAVLDDTRRDVEIALRRYFADESASSVLEADAATQRFTTGGTSRGTVVGEAIRTVMQFKGFPIAFTQRTIGRAFQGGEGGRNAGGAHIGTLIAGLTILGYAAMTAKDAIRGYEPREILDEKGNPRLATILAAVIQGGGAGIYGDFLFGEASRSGNSALENAAGPFLSDAARVANLFARARNGEAKAADFLTTGLGATPFLNIWWARPALDLLVLNELRETLSPGWMARQDQRRRQQFGQDPMLAPSDRMALDLF